MLSHQTPQPPRLTRPHVRLAASCFVLYAFYVNFGFISDNETIRYALTKAIVEDGSFRVDPYRYFFGSDYSVVDGRYYCDKPPGSSLLILPQYLLARTVVTPRLFGDWTEMARAWAVVCLSVCLYAAVSVAVLYEVLGRLGVTRGRVWYCYAYAAGTLAFPYSTVMVGDVFAASLVIVSVWFALRGDRPGHLAALGICVGLTFVTCYRAILIVGWLIPLKWLLLARRRRIVWAAAPAFGFLALQLAYNWVCFGGPLHLSYSYWQGGAAHVGFTMPSLWELYMATFSSWKGIFYYSPWLMFYFVGLAYLWRDRRVWAVYLVLGTAVYLGFMLLNNDPDTHYWWSGGDFGPRKFVPVTPLLAIGAAVGMARLIEGCRTAGLRVKVRLLCVCMVGFGVFACSLGALTSPVTYELSYENGAFYALHRPGEPKRKLDIKNPLLDSTFRALLRFGSSNLVTQLVPGTYVSLSPSRRQWWLNMLSNAIPIALMVLVLSPALFRRKP